MDNRRMRLKNVILSCCASFALCGNVFAVSNYANTISQNTPNKSFLTAMSFPKTIADVSFIERTENKAEGYKPYFNRSAFAGMTIKEQDELENMAYNAAVARETMYNTAPLSVFCANYPDDSQRCPQSATATATTITGTPPASVYDNLSQPTTNYAPSTLYMSAALTPANVAKYNLKTHNGGCTPPERNNWWLNKILTSGRYQNIDAAFEKFMITAFRKEGECGSLKNDHGGYTCYGCASNGLCAGIDMKTVTRSLVEDLAYQKIYKAYHIDKLPDAFRGYVFWGMWGSGPVTGIKVFQASLNAPQTGEIDDATIRAAENYRGDFADAYVRSREQFYRNIVAKDPSQKSFLRGWLNGLSLLRTSGCHVVPTNPIYK